MPVQDYFDKKSVIFLESEDKAGAFRELAGFFASSCPRADLNEEILFQKMTEREQTISTWIAKGIAIPHVIMPDFKPARVALGISRKGISYDAPDNEPVHLLVLIAGDGTEHLEVLRQVALRLSAPDVYKNVTSAAGREEAYRAFVSSDETTPARDEHPLISRSCFRHARDLAKEVGASRIFVHGDCLEDVEILAGADIQDIIFVTICNLDTLRKRFPANKIIQIPFKGITRANQIELSVVFALSRGLVDKSERVVSVFGLPYSGVLDTIQITEINREFKVFFSLTSGEGASDLQHQVLVRAIEIAGELAEEGREGKPSGCIFVLGDYGQVQHHCQQMIINPFRGYPEGELNILDPSLKETVKELSKIDGAFIVRGDGVMISAGTYLRTRIPLAELPSGLGARHAAAAAITMASRAVALALSESTRKLSLFKNGEKIMEL
ncbi:MAG: PTS sugar transporter subunit IIA [Spirochaetales bacterium]|jgi:DNA integrity scanning protein DisA with diadenylate cyclase activity/mannitol/fructose-specific phosphotransferase system IIA component (Ntr-type)|nr:PTS sugar transporter subunit IIA [Spirochaetales bacterium]